MWKIFLVIVLFCLLGCTSAHAVTLQFAGEDTTNGQLQAHMNDSYLPVLAGPLLVHVGPCRGQYQYNCAEPGDLDAVWLLDPRFTSKAARMPLVLTMGRNGYKQLFPIS